MKSMALLIDTNILITFLTKREDPFLAEAEKIVELCAMGKMLRLYCFSHTSYLVVCFKKTQ